jgi:DNA-binding HxlR family transcriptional regulator
MTRQSFANLDCSVALAAEHLADKWVIVILRNAFNGMKRFDDFYTHLGVSSKVLTSRLNDLVNADILYRREVVGDKRAFEYRLTPKGMDLFPLLVFMAQWADRWWPLEAGPRIEVLDRANGLPVQPVVVRNGRGRTVGPLQTIPIQGKGGSKVFEAGRVIVAQRKKMS